MQRILVVTSLFFPDVLGGAERSAGSLALYLKRQGKEVAVLTTAKTREEAGQSVNADGLTVYRVWMPRAYPMFYFSTARWWQKPLWHLQDHFDPRNRAIMGRVLDAFKPDFVNVHLIQGLGFNALQEIAARKIPMAYYLHGLELACFRMSMFKNGEECEGQCNLCQLSSKWKERLVDGVPKLGFCSPSRANLATLKRYFPAEKRPNTAIMNANRYPPATVARTDSSTTRFLYVGRLHASKGVQVLLAAAKELAEKYKLHMTVIGTGPDEAALRAEYGNSGWCEFTGFLSQAEISNHMMRSNMLCIPSIWAENSPGVVIHALGLGLPVMGSNHGGIPELVMDHKNGLLVMGDEVADWRAALQEVLDNPRALHGWSSNALAEAPKFDADNLGAELLAFMTSIAEGPVTMPGKDAA